MPWKPSDPLEDATQEQEAQDNARRLARRDFLKQEYLKALEPPPPPPSAPKTSVLNEDE